MQRLTYVVALAVLLSAGRGSAQPSSDVNMPGLVALQNAARERPELRNTTFFGDSDADKKIIYVAPSPRKSQSGRLMTVAPPNCDILESIYRLTYHVPEGDYTEAAMGRPVSPFFDYFYGIDVRYAELHRRLAEKVQMADTFMQHHGDVYQNYVAELAALENASRKADDLQEDVRAQEQADDRAYREVLDTADKSERDRKRAQHEKDRQESRERHLVKERELRAARDDERQRRVSLRRAEAAWEPFRADHAAIDRTTRHLQDTRDLLHHLAEEAFVRVEQKLSLYESTPVAFASAGYTVYDREVGELRDLAATLPELAGYLIQPLTLNNVSLSPVRATFRYGKHDLITGAQESTEVAMHGGRTGDVAQAIGFEFEEAPAIFRDDEGSALPFIQRSMAGAQGAGIFNASVARGVYCLGQAERPQTTFHGRGLEGNPVHWKGSYYAPRQTDVLAQPVALTYDYFLRAAPLSVDCSANAKKSLQFFRNQIASRSFFSAASWDKSTRKAIDDHDIACQVSTAPVEGESLEAQRIRLEAIEQRMKQELMAEFIGNVADRWSTVTKDLPVAPDALEALNRRGLATTQLCGRALVCRIVDLGLSLGRGIFGTGVHQSVVQDDEFVGNFHRSYREHHYVRAHGSTVIDLEVPL